MLNIIVPYRNRADHLAEFLAYMQNYLKDIPHRIYIIEQSDDGRLFNRGALLNFGFKLARAETTKSMWPDDDTFIFHDVDLLPDKHLLCYYKYKGSLLAHINTVYHIAGVEGNRYYQGVNFGGITSFCAQHFEAANGFPNDMEGWGGEDDELRRRVVACRIQIATPSTGSIRDLEPMTIEEKIAYLKSANLMNPHRKEAKKRHAETWRQNGLNNLRAEQLSLERTDTVVKVVVSLN